MKRYFLLFFLLSFPISVFCQGYRISLNNSNIFFNNFNNHKIIFNGISADYTYLFNRLGWNFEFDYYLPKTYFGQITFRDLIDDSITNEIPVYSKGGCYSFGSGFSFDFYRPKSQKIKIYLYSGIFYFGHKGSYNEEPFVRIYGGADVLSVNFGVLVIGVGSVVKIGYLPVNFSLKRRIKISNSKYADFNTSGYFEVSAGITFPVLKSPPPTEIHKISY